ncbi:MAG: calcium-translocating P-type ATPase, PMCA-type [Planctomycetia bacterium]|nr:calcium-translocating P-type ATPase, PMCA-type [Planctomycetia bacterium]
MADLKKVKLDEYMMDIREGLSGDQVQTMREKYGRNELTPPQHTAWWRQLLEKFKDPTIQILLVAAFASLLVTAVEKWVLGNMEAKFIETLGIFFAVLLATLVGYFSERKSAREFELLNKVKDEIFVKVLREGQITTVKISEIVVGDLVRLEPGDKVPADGVLVESLLLYVDQSMMTGESLPAKKKEYLGEFCLENLRETISVNDECFVARGTMVADGHGMFLVLSVGDHTQMGKIARALTEEMVDQNETPLTAKLSLLAKQISVVGITAAMTIFSIMAMSAALSSVLFQKLYANFPCFVGIIGCSLVSGFFLARFALKPFFASMGMEIKALWLRVLAAIPMILVSFSVILSVWGMFQPGTFTGTEMSRKVDISADGQTSVSLENSEMAEGTEIAAVSQTHEVAEMGEELKDTEKVSVSDVREAPGMESVSKTSEASEKAVFVAPGTSGETSGKQENVHSTVNTEDLELLKQILLAFVVAVTIIVVAVPEGLPMMVTVSLALNMMKMARENCLVRKLVASETIGSATVICTDKTGTLTQNQMKPVWVFTGQKEYVQENMDLLMQTPEWEELVHGITINSDANLHITYKENSQEKVVTGVGNPTECALLKFVESYGVDYMEYREKYSRVYELGHNSQRKMSVVVVAREGENHCFVKGAPERVLAECSFVLINGKIEPLEPSYKAELDAAILRASEQALRVLAFSVKHMGNAGMCEGSQDETAKMCLECKKRVFVGLIGIADPIRQEVPAAVHMCQEAGVAVKMITGDALPTAVAIARNANIYHGTSEELALTSEQFNCISDEDLLHEVKKIKVLARSTPMDKLRMVKALHVQGEVIAMTGDGTNDAPALKFADVGLSMGVTGTEVAKEASDIVLVDDNFKSIVTGIWWGRTLFQNIQRFLQFQLSVNVVALLCALIGPMIGVPLPLTVTQLLWINIIMDTFAALALSTEPPRSYTMKEKPISRNAHIITSTMGVSILVVSLYQVAILFLALFGGWFLTENNVYNFIVSPTSAEYRTENLEALTVFFTILIMFQFWHKINCRSLRHNESPFSLLTKNKMFIGIITVITVVQILMVQSPWAGEIFRTMPLQLWQWVGITLLTMTVIPVAWMSRKLAYWLQLE